MIKNAFGNYISKRRRIGTVLDKMLTVELIKVLVSILLLLVSILVSQQFVKILGRALEGSIATDTVLSMLFLTSLLLGIKFLPAASFMSILVVLGRMYRDHEMDVLASAGVGLGKLYQGVLLLMLPVSIVGFFLAFYAGPWIEAKIEKLKYNDQQTVELRGLVAGRFHDYKASDMVFFIENVDDQGPMTNIFVQNKKAGTLSIITAKYGSFQDLPAGRFIVLEDGQRTQGLPGTMNFVIEKFHEYAFLIKKTETRIGFDQEAISSADLWHSGTQVDWSELQQRFTIPMGIIILSFLAVPLARMAPRRGVYGNIAISFLIYFSYENIQKFNQAWMVKGKIPIWLGFSWVYLLMFLVLVLLVIKFYGTEWSFLRFKKRSSL